MQVHPEDYLEKLDLKESQEKVGFEGGEELIMIASGAGLVWVRNTVGIWGPIPFQSNSDICHG